ncbi:hypothetical protein HU200_056481 [Digitaria exilis]|uniref:Uncharacterized protein n=1 Tax=Digitaria exilis TaxID=1010633 RepID=A0A835E586_9POAL|nr:hypothetical protein HU200_056481 [Digitaria exilis]
MLSLPIVPNEICGSYVHFFSSYCRSAQCGDLYVLPNLRWSQLISSAAAQQLWLQPLFKILEPHWSGKQLVGLVISLGDEMTTGCQDHNVLCYNVFQAVELEFKKPDLMIQRLAKLSYLVVVILVSLLDSLARMLAAVEEGIVGDGCTLLRLASKVDSIIESLENDKQQVDERSHHV